MEKIESRRESDGGALDGDLLERQFSGNEELEKSVEDDLSADLLHLMVPVATDR